MVWQGTSVSFMPRKLRLEFAGACYHVTNRGNYRRDLFAGPGVAETFYRCLYEACTSFRWVVHACTVMGNHVHLALGWGRWGPPADLEPESFSEECRQSVP